MLTRLYRLLLRRKLFKGQFRLFLYLLKKNHLKNTKTITKPVTGNFKINVDTKNLIDACIYFTGDYEPYLKKHFAHLIHKGDTILDVGANIGFHSLYFAELTGQMGKVLAFEPISVNYQAFKNNLLLNDFPQVIPINKALGNVNEFVNIHIKEEATNPGSFNLFEKGILNTTIECIKGDDYLDEKDITKVDFMKIDVEGFELEVIKGLVKTIKRDLPILIFEYDQNYQLKTQIDPKEIFYFLAQFSYDFFKIDGYGNRSKLHLEADFGSAEILAIPNTKSI